MKGLKGKNELIIGSCVLIALAVLFFGIEYLKGINIFKPSNSYSAIYTDVAGLQVSAPVTINGLKVGQVSNIEYQYDNPGHVKVDFSLDKALSVPQGSQAIIEQDLLGTSLVVLHFTQSKTYLERGSTLEGLTSKGLMGEVSQKLLPNVDKLFGQVDTLMTSLNALVANPALNSSVTRLDEITLNINRTVRDINASVRAVDPILANVNHISRNVDGITGNLGTVSGDLATLSGMLTELPVDSMMNNLVALSANLHSLSKDLADPNSTLGALTHDRALYNNLNNAAASLDSLLIDVKAHPKRYISIKLL